MNFSELSLDNLNFDWLAEKITTYSIKIIAAIGIIVIGFWIASKVTKLIRHEMAKTNLSISLKKVVGDILSVVM